MIFKYYKKVWSYFWYIWCIPGHIMLWIGYYFPTEWGKNRNVTMFGRQMREKHIFAPINSLFFFIFPVLSFSLFFPYIAIPHAIFFAVFLFLFLLPLLPVMTIIYFAYNYDNLLLLFNNFGFLLPF